MPEATPDTGATGAPTMVITELLTGASEEDPAGIESGTEEVTDWEAESKRLQGEADKYKALARKHEDRAKANADAAKKLTEVERSSMSDIEKARAEAADKATTEAMSRMGGRLVAAEVKAAAAGRQVDVDALLEGIDVTRFLDDDGEPKVKDITSWLDRVAPVKATVASDLGQGARGGPTKAPTMNDLIRRGAGY